MKGSYCKAYITHIASYLATIIFMHAYITWPICISMIHKHICDYLHSHAYTQINFSALRAHSHVN